MPDELFDEVVERLIESGEVKVWKAEEVALQLTRKTAVAAPEEAESRSSASGKVILLGEHAVVYGRSALAAPIPLTVEARVVDASEGVRLLIPRWGLEQRIASVSERPTGAAGMVATLLQQLDLDGRATQTAAIRLYERAGFRKWATKEKYAFVGGAFVPGYFFEKDLEASSK